MSEIKFLPDGQKIKVQQQLTNGYVVINVYAEEDGSWYADSHPYYAEKILDIRPKKLNA